METAILLVLSIIMEFIDSFLGMMYGTVLSPLLIIMGYSVSTIVPSLLLSQAIGGFIASYRHHKLQNGSFKSGTIDSTIAWMIISMGVVACLIGVMVSVSISPKILKTYISGLVILIGILILLNKTLSLTKGKIFFLGFVSAFNKALSGGGFGPLVAGGQLVFKGRDEKGSIASTDFAEAPICLISFLIWVSAKGFPDLHLLIPLSIGAAIGGFFGPKALSKVTSKTKLKYILAVLVLIEGLWVLYRTWLK